MNSALSRHNSLALLAVCFAALMFGLEISSVPVILPTLETVLGATFKDMQWIMNAYTIACTTVLMATGSRRSWQAAVRADGRPRWLAQSERWA